MVKHAWEFLYKSNMAIETNHAIPKLLRENNSPIMDKIMKQTTFDKIEIKDINDCRMYLNVFSIADITEGNRHQIKIEAIEGQRDKHIRSQYK